MRIAQKEHILILRALLHISQAILHSASKSNAMPMPFGLKSEVLPNAAIKSIPNGLDLSHHVISPIVQFVNLK
jgi:hypothetical protein